MKIKRIVALILSVCMLSVFATLVCGAEGTGKNFDEIAQEQIINKGYVEDACVAPDLTKPLDSHWVFTLKDLYTVNEGVMSTMQSTGSYQIKYQPGEALASAKKYVWSFDYRVDDLPEGTGELCFEFVSADIRFLAYFKEGGKLQVALTKSTTYDLGIKTGDWNNFTIVRFDNNYTFYLNGVKFAEGTNDKSSSPFVAAKNFGMFFISKPGTAGTDNVGFAVRNIKYVTYKEASTVSIDVTNAQLPTGLTAESASASVRLLAEIKAESLDGYDRAGFVVSKTNTAPVVNAENAVTLGGTEVYTSILADETTLTAETFGCDYILALKINQIPKADFGTSLYVRPYLVGTDGTVTYGNTVKIAVADLLKG